MTRVLKARARNPLPQKKCVDPIAFGELFAQHQRKLLQIIRLRLDPRLTTRLDAEDVLQEVFLDALARFQYYDGQRTAAFFNWLCLVTKQTMANLRRRHLGTQKRDVRRDVSIDTGHLNQAQTRRIRMQLATQSNSPSKMIMLRESFDKLEQAVACLKPMDREVIVLRHFELLDNKDVAQILGITKKAASIRYARAMHRLKESVHSSVKAESGNASPRSIEVT